MGHPTIESQDFYIDKLSPLVDGKIKAIAIDDSDEHYAYFGLVITKTNGQDVVLWMLSDDEGNAPASFNIQEE